MEKVEASSSVVNILAALREVEPPKNKHKPKPSKGLPRRVGLPLQVFRDDFKWARPQLRADTAGPAGLGDKSSSGSGLDGSSSSDCASDSD